MVLLPLISLVAVAGMGQIPVLAHAGPSRLEGAYNANNFPLSAWDKKLLAQNGFTLRPDGSVWARDAAEAILESEMPFLLQRLQGKIRLKTLIAIELIYNRSDEGRRLSTEDRQNLKVLLSHNWPAFSFRMRQEFKKYFSAEEREALDRSIGPPSAIPPSAKLLESLPDLPDEESLPALPAEEAVAAVSAPLPTPAAPAPAAVPAPPLTVPEIAPPVLPMPTPAPILPALAAPASGLSPKEFEGFLADAPYGKDAKAMLKLISAHAPGFARLKALQTVANYLPPISLESSGLGSALRGALHPLAAAPGGATVEIVVSPGLVLLKRRGLLTSSEFLLSRAPQAYPSLGLAAGALKAWQTDQIPARRGPSEWGEAQFYDDNSMAASSSLAQRAGVLLYQLLLLHARQKGAGDDPAAEVFARSAQQMFYAKLPKAEAPEGFLDPEAARAHRQWIAEPWDWRDHMIHTMAAGKEDFAQKAQAAASRPLALELSAFEGKYRQEASDAP